MEGRVTRGLKPRPVACIGDSVPAAAAQGPRTRRAGQGPLQSEHPSVDATSGRPCFSQPGALCSQGLRLGVPPAPQSASPAAAEVGATSLCPCWAPTAWARACSARCASPVPPGNLTHSAAGICAAHYRLPNPFVGIFRTALTPEHGEAQP